MDLGGPGLIVLFVVAAAATWTAGLYLSKATDALDVRLGLGEALGGAILLAVAGSLPELAITISAISQGNLDIAAGNLIGGIAMQTLVLVICDRAVKGDNPLSYLVGSLNPLLEGLLVIIVTAIMLMGTMLPESAAVGPFSPASIAIVVAWVVGIFILNRIRSAEPWQVAMPGSRPGRRHRREKHPVAPKPFEGSSTLKVVLVFAGASVVTLIAGVTLETSGSALADMAGINGVVFGATFLAAATALPEISTGVTAVRLGDNQLAMSDIFGGNAFQLTLFVFADLLAGKPVLPQAGTSNAWLGALGIVMTVVYAASILIRIKGRHFGLGLDSIVVTLIYVLGVVGLLQISS